jgi:hypothetical protein
VPQLVGPEITDRLVLRSVRGLFDQLADGADAFGAAEQHAAEARCYAMTLALFRPLRDLLGAEYMRTSALSQRGSLLVQDASRRDRERGGQGRGERGRGDTIASMTEPSPQPSRGEDAAGSEDEHDEATTVSILLCTVTFHANLAHSLTCSP